MLKFNTKKFVEVTNINNLKEIYKYLNKLFKLSFKDPTLEDRFQKEYLEDHDKQNKIAISIVIMLCTIFTTIVYIVIPNDFSIVLVAASIIIVLSILVFFVIIKNKFKEYKLLILSIYTAIGSCAPAMVFYYSAEHYQIYLMTYIVAMVCIFMMLGIPIISAFLISFIGTSLFIFFLFVLDISSEIIIFNIFFILSTLIVTAFSGFMIEIIKRKNYLAKYELEDLNEKIRLEVKKQVEENRKKDKLMFQQSKLASMGEMLNNIAHQWRQPLNEINSSVVVIDFNLIKNNIKNKEIESKLLDIEKQTDYMSNTIENFMNYFKPDKKQYDFLLSSVVNKTLNVLETNIKKHNIQVSIQSVTDKSISGYPGEYKQVLVNIINNAIDAFVENDTKNRNLKITIDNKIIIDDNAGGIPDKIFDKIFEPYFTTKEPTQGTGIGLYMAKMLIEDSMNGKLKVKKINNGTRFIIEI